MATGLSVQNLLDHLELLGDMSQNRYELLNQPAYQDEEGNFILKGNLVAARGAINTFPGAYCGDLANNLYLEELQDLANRLELRITPETTKQEICQMINQYVLDSDIEPYYIDIDTSRKTFTKMMAPEYIFSYTPEKVEKDLERMKEMYQDVYLSVLTRRAIKRFSTTEDSFIWVQIDPFHRFALLKTKDTQNDLYLADKALKMFQYHINR